jgi:hypothetical protein
MDVLGFEFVIFSAWAARPVAAGYTLQKCGATQASSRSKTSHFRYPKNASIRF